MELFIFCATIFLCTFAYCCHYFTKVKIESNIYFDDKNTDTNIITDCEYIDYQEETHPHVFNNEEPHWIKSGEVIAVAGKEITGGNFYFGNKSHSSYLANMDAFLVDDNFNIENTNKNYLDHTGKFLPKFSLLSPKCKGAFIDWLASDRTDAAVPILYPLIYFYGLEYRIIYDCKDKSVDDSEYYYIFTELKFLRQIFKKNIYFYSKLTRLMEVMAFKKPHLVSMPTTNLALVKESLFFNYELAKLAITETPLTYDMALAWLWQSDNYKFNQQIVDKYDLFSEIFKLQFQNKFCDNLIIAKSNVPLQLKYKSSIGLIHNIKLIKDMLAAEKSPDIIQQLATMANKCTEILIS